jgi:hypothetical protein
MMALISHALDMAKSLGALYPLMNEPAMGHATAIR